MKSRSLAKWALEIAMRSMMGVTCSARDRGCVSLNHSVALNLEIRKQKERKKGRAALRLSQRLQFFFIMLGHNVISLPAFIIPLDFTCELDRTPDVPAVQVELRIEVFLGCDGCGVVRTGTLGHVALTEGQML